MAEKSYRDAIRDAMMEEMDRDANVLRTLADTHGSNAVAIVLSGADSDGAIGIKRIKERGGLTIAQDPQEAEQGGMPRSTWNIANSRESVS